MYEHVAERCRPYLKPTNKSYRIAETYIKVKGQDRYLYRIDSTGQIIDFLLAARGNDSYRKRSRHLAIQCRESSTFDTTVVGELLGDLMSCGLDFTQPRLYVPDDGKALMGCGEKSTRVKSAAIQRCQVHKRRNVLDHR